MRNNLILIIIVTCSLYLLNVLTNGEVFQNILNLKKITRIEIINLKNVSKDYLIKRISIKEGQSFWTFNPLKLKDDLQKIKEIKSFSFLLNLDGILKITIEEQKPFLKFNVDGNEKFIDIYGNILEFKINDLNSQIIKLEGKNANLYLNSIHKFLLNKNNLIKNINSIFFEDNVGWKIVFSERSCVFLPLKKLDKVIDIFKNVTESDLYKNFNFFDLRIIGRIYMSKKEC